MQRQKQQKKKVYTPKKVLVVWNVNIDISKRIEIKTNVNYLIGYLDKVIKLLVLILPKISGYVKIFKDKNNQSTSFRINDWKLLEKY